MSFFAYRDESPLNLAVVERRLRSTAKYAWVGVFPGSQWVIGHGGDLTRCRDGVFVVDGERNLSGQPAGALAKNIGSSEWSATIASLPGDFNFACVDTERFAFVHAAAGPMPAYYWESSGRLAIATRVGDIALLVPDEPCLDPLAVATLSSWFGWAIQNRSLLAGAKVMQGGEVVLASRGSPWSATRWWDPSRVPAISPSPARLKDHADRLRDALVANLARDLPEDGSGLISLSGGVDSSALVALAGRQLGREFSTVSFLPPAEPLYSRIKGYIDPLLESFSPRVRRRWEYDSSYEQRWALLDEAPRELALVAHPVLCVLSRLATTSQLSTLCGGEFCDELFGSQLTLADWAHCTRWSDLLVQGGPLRGRGLRYWGEHRLRRWLSRPKLMFPSMLPSFISPAVREIHRELFDQERRLVSHDPRPRVYLAKTIEASAPVIHINWEVTSRLGIRRVFPFYSRELVELAFECHPAEGTVPGTKKLLRTALEGMVPARNLLRPEKTEWTPTTPRFHWKRPLGSEFKGIVRDDWLSQPPKTLPAFEALRLKALVNIVDSLGNVRAARRTLAANSRE